jgi:hypothetical protein
MKLTWLFIIVFVEMCFYGFKAEAQFSKYSNDFLNIGAGARAMGMGNAQVASADDATAGYWNPAGLVYVDEYPSLSLMHADYFSGIGKYDFAAMAFPMNDSMGTLGFTLLRFGVDDIPNTLFLVNPDGSLNYNNISNFSSADYAMLLSYSRIIKNDDPNTELSFGANAKILYQKVGSFATAWGFGFDAGFMAKTPTWRLGVVAKDVTTTFNAWSFNFTSAEQQILYETNNNIPSKSTELTSPSLLIGGGYNFAFGDNFHLLTEADFDMTFDGQRNTLISTDPLSIDPRIGLEANISNVVFIRAGVSNFQQALADGDTLNQKKVWIFQPSIGAGFKIGNVSIDYAFTNLANQSNPLYTNVFSLRVDFMPRQKGEHLHKGYFPKLPPNSKPSSQKGYYPQGD